MLLGMIRHGLTDWNAMGKIQGQSDIALNDEGRRQARLLGERLLQEPFEWHAVVTSHLSRARETGEILGKTLNIPVLEPDQRLQERAYGEVEGLTQEDREARWGKEWHLLDLGQESEEALIERGMQFLQDVWDKHQDKNLLVVSHGALLAQLYSRLYPEHVSERIGNLSLTVIKREDLEWMKVLFNSTDHLL